MCVLRTKNLSAIFLKCTLIIMRISQTIGYEFTYSNCNPLPITACDKKINFPRNVFRI